ncbi:flagellar export protein FliJ [Clostridium autoethanogenum]|uniref:Flagellar FliJ protein n=2 Tax=Bacteria TaxID=2 RepID=A0ABN4BM98_9CLOT|nr:flagellar export protein FliJ [Clostridium autoethanogenum]AGY77319.1 flagellar export protein FliJ [Clostridium autoethanogenum DSM 10061]ALU37461.1 Flagellar export protein fliJ [Clostridium autoethanogenum DSM 10061]OVY49108.1 flagellar biosynthesis chaperone [Clostridium autoethanogenum]
MGKYKFRLQKLLDIRIDKEEESKREFQQARRESLKVKEKLGLLKANYEKYNNMSNFKSVIEQKITHKYLKALVYSIDKTQIELKDKEKIVEMKRNELQKRQIDRKTVDILKEKEETAFIKEQNRIEQKANDEFALYGFIRNIQNT